MRANTQHNKGDRRQEGQDWEGQNRNRDIRRSVEGRGMGWGTWGIWTLQGLSGRKAGNLKEVGLGGLSGVEKIEDLDRG